MSEEVIACKAITREEFMIRLSRADNRIRPQVRVLERQLVEMRQQIADLMQMRMDVWLAEQEGLAVTFFLAETDETSQILYAVNPREQIGFTQFAGGSDE